MSLRAFFLMGLALCAPVAPAAAADAFSSDWANGLKSSARLIAAGPANGVLQAAVEIELAPGAITYWRNPGDAGLPPTLSFDGSTNLSLARADFPAPRRLVEKGGGEAFGYSGALVLPIDVEPADAGKPTTLALKLDYAVCEAICVPAQAKLRLDLPGVHAAPSPFSDAIARAKALVPKSAPWDRLAADLTVVSDKVWRLCLPHQAGPRRDLFIEPPDAWWFDVRSDAAPAGRDCFNLSLAQQPKDSSLPITAQLTITGGEGPLETTVELNSAVTR